MDTYFTLVKTVIGTRKCGVVVMGTARARYVLDNVCMCMCMCVCVYVYMCVFIIATKYLSLLLLDSTGHP